ncbi:hypothetical protein BH23PLA1_BH23PLA1_12960 [soil metagenome]
MRPDRRLTETLSQLQAILGAPGLIIALVSVVSFGFGLIILAREYNRLGRTSREAYRRSLVDWVESTPVDGQSRTLRDYAYFWRQATDPDDRAIQEAILQDVLQGLGADLDSQDDRLSTFIVLSLELGPRGDPPLASWHSIQGLPAQEGDLVDRVNVLQPGPGPAVDLVIQYRTTPEIGHVSAELETSYRRLLLAVAGLSGYPLVCLGYMMMQARYLRDRAARESAQQATLDLADRTCHELGNVVFVLANERRNLSGHLELVEQFLDQQGEALEAASRRARLDPSQLGRLRQALSREYASRGIDPEVELRSGAVLARDVCRQIAVCSEYIALTVRELDGYLKQSALPVSRTSLNVAEALGEALTLLGPRLEAASVRIDREEQGNGPAIALADHRLLVHALVNLLKNAVEAATSSGTDPRICLRTHSGGPVVRIEIADNGPGIPKPTLAHIFDFGYSTKGPGRGRGLAIARESIRAQGGRIEVNSQTGAGTTFTIELPAAEEVASEISRPSDSPR